MARLQPAYMKRERDRDGENKGGSVNAGGRGEGGFCVCPGGRPPAAPAYCLQDFRFWGKLKCNSRAMAVMGLVAK